MKKLFTKIHLWLSIPFGIILVIVCLTGSILVFEKELLEACYPSRYYVKEAKGEPLPTVALISAARQQLPDSVKITGIRVFPDPKRTYQLVLPARKAAVFVNPYTGEITGTDDGKGFFLDMMRLHRWLLDEYKRDGSFSWGKALVGYSTLVLVIILISGIVIWFPRTKKALKNRLKIRTRNGWFRFFYDLHVAGGFYATLLLLALALTGLTWSFSWYRNTFYSVFGVSTSPIQAHGPSAQKETTGERKKGKREEYREKETNKRIRESSLTREKKAAPSAERLPPLVAANPTRKGTEAQEDKKSDNRKAEKGANPTEESKRYEPSERPKGERKQSEGRKAGQEEGNERTKTEKGKEDTHREKTLEKTDYTVWGTVLVSLQNRYPDFNSITVQNGTATVSTAQYGNTRGSDRYSFDPETGRITEVQLYKDLPKSSKIRGWIYSVHVGSWGGITTRILSCLVSLLGAVFAITGYYFWIKKKTRKRNKLNQPPKRKSSREKP